MKVIIQGLIIETSFIVSIDKEWQTFDGCAESDFSTLELLLFVFSSGVIRLTIGSTKEYSSLEEAKEEREKLEIEANRLIKFLDDHSDKPNWPYPIFE